MQNIASQGKAEVPLKTGRYGKTFLLFGVVIALALIVGVFIVARQNIESSRANIEQELIVVQHNLVFSRAKDIERWLEGVVDKSKQLADSNFFQLFSAEVDSMESVPVIIPEPDLSMPGFYDGDNPAARLPLMRAQLQDFVGYAGLVSGVIVNSKGEAYISTGTAMPALNTPQKNYVAAVVESGKEVFSPLVKDQKGFMIEIYIPIFPPSFENTANRPVAVLILTKLVSNRLAEFLVLRSASKSRSLHLVQNNSGEWQEVVLSDLDLEPVNVFMLQNGEFPFSMRESLDSKREVFSTGKYLEKYDWWLIVEDSADVVLAEHQQYVADQYKMAILCSVVLVLLLSALWWWLVGKREKGISSQFQQFASVIEEQKKLLDGINNTISDPISLVSDKGVYQYVNRAFAAAVGRNEGDIVGLDGPAVFGFDTARRLNIADQHVLMTGENVSIEDIIWLQSKRYYFQISKAPLRDAETKTPYGIVSVYRDITQLKETEERSRRVVQQTIDALVAAIEQADPFLGGHSRIMGGIAGLIAKELRLSDVDIATVQAAANLSQIGKMFVPREILLKPGILTPEEKAIMEKHVEYTKKALENIEFDLPVVETIYEMNELMNGKGYPRGLTGDAISLCSRILAVANAFTAMARPRAYRPAIPVADVLKILENQADAYDQNVVEALRQVLTTPVGEKVVQLAATGHAG